LTLKISQIPITKGAPFTGLEEIEINDALTTKKIQLLSLQTVDVKVTSIGTPGNDINYPTEKAVRDALDLKENSANKGAVSGYAGLDSSQELLLANFPSGNALEVLRRNAANTALEFGVGGLTFGKVVKSVDEIRTENTVLADDAELFVPLEANKTYSYLLLLMLQSPFATNFVYEIVGPSGAAVQRSASTWSSNTPQNFGTGGVIIATSGLEQMCFVAGRVVVAGTAGNLSFQWSQNVSSTGDTIVLKGATLLVWEE